MTAPQSQSEREREINRILRETKRRKIRAPITEMGQFVGECHWSKTGWAIYNKNGGCTCEPARAPTLNNTGTG